LGQSSVGLYFIEDAPDLGRVPESAIVISPTSNHLAIQPLPDPLHDEAAFLGQRGIEQVVVLIGPSFSMVNETPQPFRRFIA
jgi:hypothetical protein